MAEGNPGAYDPLPHPLNLEQTWLLQYCLLPHRRKAFCSFQKRDKASLHLDIEHAQKIGGPPPWTARLFRQESNALSPVTCIPQRRATRNHLDMSEASVFMAVRMTAVEDKNNRVL